MTKVLRTLDYIGHILKAIERIDRYTADMDEVGFLNSDLVQDAVIRNIEILGEASNNIQRVAPEFAARHDDIPWKVMYTMRNRVSHGYDKVDLEIIWNMLQSDLPGLHAQVTEVQASLTKNHDHGGMDP
ncbi:HepT-like ribonuclease domain-containing protein [Verminephrobacter aporrectodeae]|uniref:DUF86 domain-containing protein n=1 Tax=Verminephrobacter aporrectodeae subsp. tuberculatae TaxID=1110392 RepID=A0ABT3KRC2_9BURK|nr:DUF86 domain-containing protein [Verminephrobacter aporrectodeae]MCW5220187.1 DUF86 domain-containing protein [Verminephrobacter aporrectodeae subsp. tuberculatae]MCW5255843.1 DUF86 domain-containing protein [Verminephrobacter aporrectodeae subsp. tuberculatae]MCW5289475.1 DUF86 domain-containing protein [Verminephrobacter aporrectodeae subsp. tuberculatae]MCW5320864.1 DUF86 domain-containing protein [Verminephrobacter aporrectodeae subsp. tuberculatae]MCW8166037.1 DUF86 domain-containing p